MGPSDNESRIDYNGLIFSFGNFYYFYFLVVCVCVNMKMGNDIGNELCINMVSFAVNIHELSGKFYTTFFHTKTILY